MIESAGTYAAMSTLTGRVHQSHAKMAAASTQTTIRARRTISIRAHPNRRPKHQARRPQAERLRADAAPAFARLGARTDSEVGYAEHTPAPAGLPEGRINCAAAESLRPEARRRTAAPSFPRKSSTSAHASALNPPQSNAQVADVLKPDRQRSPAKD